ncbi:hypothetical protein Hanom_Chr07g00641681 [Helianthus anomalus]
MVPYIQSIPTISIMCETCNTINTDTLAILSGPHPHSFDVKPPPEPDRRGIRRGIILFTKHVVLFRDSPGSTK